MGAILEITDGTELNTINLLGRYNGYLLCDWRPARPEFEHILNRNFLTGTETPAMVIQKPAIDTFTFSARNGSADDLIDDEQKMSRILYLASLYWTRSRGVPNPYYLKAKNRDETGLRYAAIFTTQLHDSGNPYTTPFFSNIATDTDLVVPVTHGSWLDYPPGTGGFSMEANLMSMIWSEITGGVKGTVSSEEGAKILLSNMLSHVVLSNIFRGDVDLLAEPTTGYDLFSLDTSEYTVFVIRYIKDTFILKENGLVGIQFNITTPAINPRPGFDWEVLTEVDNVSSWKSIDVIDGTNGFTKSGFVLFDMSEYGDNLGVSLHHGFMAYQIRARPTRIRSSAVPTPLVNFASPVVSYFHPASINLPYFDILFAGNQYISPTTQVMKPVHNARNLFTPRFQSPDSDIDYFLKYTVRQIGNPSIAGTFDLEFSAVNSNNKPDEISWQIYSPRTSWTDLYGDVVKEVIGAGDYIAKFRAGIGLPYVTARGTWEYGTMSNLVSFKTAPDFSSSVSPEVGGDLELVSQGYAGITEFTFDSAKSILDMDNDEVDYIEWTFGDENVIPPPSEDLEILRVDRDARFEMWDDSSLSYKEIVIDTGSLGPILKFRDVAAVSDISIDNYGWLNTKVSDLGGKVKVTNLLRMNPGSVFGMWDDVYGKERAIHIDSSNGILSLNIAEGLVLNSASRLKVNTFDVQSTIGIDGTLVIGENTFFEMWDDDASIFRRIMLSNIGGKTKLVFANASGWDGKSATLGTRASTIGSVVKHIYQKFGAYTVHMAIHMKSGRRADVWKSDSIHIHPDTGSIAYFVAKQPRGFAPHDPGFDASGSTVVPGAAVTYAWNFGDGGVGTGIKPSHVYTKHGIYSVTLTTTDSRGRKNSFTRNAYIYIDSEVLYAGDNGMYLELGFKLLNLPELPEKVEPSITKMYIGSRSLIDKDDDLFQGYIPFYKNSWDLYAATRPYPLKLNPLVFEIREHDKSYTGYAYTGRVDRSSVGHGAEKELMSLRVPKELAHVYKGTYRLFMRLSVDEYSATDRFYFWAGASQYVGSGDAPGGRNTTRKETDSLIDNLVTTIDLGSISLGGRDGMTQDINIYWQGFFSGSWEQNLSVFDVILIPQDEWFAEITFPANRKTGDLFTIGSITPDGGLETSVTGARVKYVPSSTPNTPLSLLGNDVRFTTLSTVHDRAKSIEYAESNPNNAIPVQYSFFNLVTEVSKALKVSKFFGSRGKR